MGFQQGLSGLASATKQLDVIGNNVANSSTVGFKQSQVKFADVYASTVNGVAATQAGIGSKVAGIDQQFTQGTITGTSNPLDLAVNGDGFFRVSNNGVISYSRDGQFKLDKTGYIVNSTGARLTGFMADEKGVLATGAQTDINIVTSDIKPQQTANVSGVMNLDSRSPILSSAAFDPTDPSTYTSSTSVSVYDSLGNASVLQTYYVKTADGKWDVFGTDEGTKIGAGPLGTLTFKSDGTIDTAATTLPFSVSMSGSGGAATPFTMNLDFKGSTQFGGSFGVTTLQQDGYTSGRLAGFTVGNDGIITGRYSNGKTSTLGQVVLASFKNPNGLQPLGNNEWSETAESGAALVGTPGTGTLGSLQSSAIEESNVDLTSELVEMITAQRAYQANAQTIKTEDQVMQTLVNLR
jgi:flagellar hook protein FlgE